MEEAIYPRFREALFEATQDFPTGDPSGPGVRCGPLLGPEEADRIVRLIAEAGGEAPRREGNLVWPSVVENPTPGSALLTEEAFGPVVTLSSFTDFDEALARVNASAYGIHAGLYSRDEARIARAYAGLEVGGLVVGDVPTVRFDALPYGGVKRSGFGREGVRAAMDTMSQPRTLVRRVA